MSDDMMPEDTADAIRKLQIKAHLFLGDWNTPAEFIEAVIRICKTRKNDAVFAERLMYQLMQFYLNDSALPDRCQVPWLRARKEWAGDSPPPMLWLTRRITREAMQRRIQEERRAFERAAQRAREAQLEQAIQEEREAEFEWEWQIDQWLTERERRGHCCPRCAAAGLSWRSGSGGISSGFTRSARAAPSGR